MPPASTELELVLHPDTAGMGPDLHPDSGLGLGFVLGKDYDEKKKKLQQELQQDFKLYVSQKKDWKRNQHDFPHDATGVSLPIYDHTSVKEKLREEREKEYKLFLVNETTNRCIRRGESAVPLPLGAGVSDIVNMPQASARQGPVLHPDRGLGFVLGTEYERKKKKLQQELQQDFRRHNSKLGGGVSDIVNRPSASARRGPALHPDRGLGSRQGTEYERKKKLHPLANGYMLGASEEENKSVAELKKGKYKAELLEQIAENQRNRVGVKTLERSVDATGATDLQKEETQRNHSGSSQRYFNAPPMKCPGLGTGAPGNEALLDQSSENNHRDFSKMLRDRTEPRAAGLDPQVCPACHTVFYATPHNGTPASAPPPHNGTPASAPPPHNGTPAYAPHPYNGTPASAPPPHNRTPAYAPPPQNGTPAYAPPPHNGTPAYAPPPQNRTPAYAPPPHNGTPAYAPPPQNRTPAYAPPPQNRTPAYAPPPQNRTPAYAPPPHNGTPAYAPPPQNGTPAYAPPPQNGTPAYAPPPHNGTPAYAPPPQNGTPAYAPPPHNGTPAYALNPHFGTRNPLEPSLPYNQDAPCREPYQSGRPIDQRSSAAIEVSNQSKKSQFQREELWAEKSGQQRESSQNYQEALKQQIKEKEKHKEMKKREKERYDAQIEAERMAYNPWGRGGGGAPIKDKQGNLHSDLRQMHYKNNETMILKEPRSSSHRAGAQGPFSHPTSALTAEPHSEQVDTREKYQQELRQQIEECRRKKMEKIEREMREDLELEKKKEKERALLQKEYDEEQKKIQMKV